MHPHLRTAAAVVIIALTVAACGGSATASSPSAAATAAPTAPAASVEPSASAGPADSAPAASPAASPTASPGAVESAAPSATPTPEQQALMDRMPKKVGTIALLPHAVDAEKLINSDPVSNKGLVDFLTKVGLTPKDLLIVFAMPTAATQIQFTIGAYRFVGADPTTLKKEFIQANLAQQAGASVEDRTVGGRPVVALLAPAGDSGPPIYLLFEGDTVYVADSSDADFAAAAVKALP